MTRVVASALVVLLAYGGPSPAAAYVKFGLDIGGTTVEVKWKQPIRYFVNERDISGVSATDFRGAVARAAASWQGVASATVSFDYQGFTVASPGGLDGRTTLGFLDRPDLDRVLGATSFLVDATTGEILEADVFFNSRFEWSVAAQGEAGKVDLESVVLHELGHVIGLGHSALGETERTGTGNRRVTASGAIMFPIAMSAGAVADRVLQADDIAGASDLYPEAGLSDRIGTIRGRILKDGQGVFGAHVVAFNPRTGSLIGTFTLSTTGEFVVSGLSPGPHILRVEPLDDAETGSFFSGPIDMDFRVGYAPALIVAPQGGASEPVNITVLPK